MNPEYANAPITIASSAPLMRCWASFFGVARRTIQNWIAAHPDFADAVHRGRAVADGVIVRALFERAKGFSHEVTRTTLYRGEEHKITNTVSYPPDTQACMFWLRNRQREYWQARAGAPLEPEIVDDMAARLDAAGESMRHAAEYVPDCQIAGGNCVSWPMARRRSVLARRTYSPTLLCMIPPSAKIVVAVR